MTSVNRGTWVDEVLVGAPSVWTLDPSATTLEFQTRSFWGLLKIRGNFKAVEGEGRVTETGIEGTLVIDASSIGTGNKKLDQHLRSSDWFESELHPTFVFDLHGATPIGDEAVRLDGAFTVREHSRSLNIVAAVAEVGTDAFDLKSEFQIDRRDWDISVTKMGAKTRTHIAVSARWRRTDP
jgi:polyisoprenoid-binding protein YceI